MTLKRLRLQLSPEDRKITDPERSRKRTMDRAIRLLAAKSRSVRELRDRLLEKAWTDEKIVDSVIEKLTEYKYLDDEKYARDLALSRLRQKPQGKLALQVGMSRKKLDRETVADAVAEAFEKVSEEELIDVVIEKRIRLRGRPRTRDETRKLYDHLLRRGFGYELVRSRVGAVLDGQREFPDNGE